jgi:hypothetical protein
MTNGLVVMTPSSIAYSGTSASINADGSVVFSACSSLSLNGVFTADYDNYMVTVRMKMGSSFPNLYMRLRALGTDASGSNYTRQYLTSSGTTTDANRLTSLTEATVGFTTAVEGGTNFYVFGPYLAQPTATRSVGVAGYAGAYLQDDACTHSLSTSYDGLTLFPSTSNCTGLLTVFGFNQ